MTPAGNPDAPASEEIPSGSVLLKSEDKVPAIVPALTRSRLRLLTLVGLSLLFLALSFLLILPFLPGVTWAVALAIMAWPIHKRIYQRLPQPTLAALTSSLVVVLLILLPMGFVIYQLAREATGVAEQLSKVTEGGVRQKLGELPGLDAVLNWMDRVNLNFEQGLRQMVQTYAQGTQGLARGSIDAILQFLMMVFILFHLFKDRSQFRTGLREMLPLTEAETNQVMAHVADSVHANLYATVVTSLVNGIGGGFWFWVLGLPVPILWGIIIFVLSILPVVGAGMVWVPAVIYLGMTGRWGAAGVLLAWGLFTAIFNDNLFYVRLAGNRMRMHPVPALIAFLGGLAVFGISGIILGPAIMSVTLALLDMWQKRMHQTLVVLDPPGEPRAP